MDSKIMIQDDQRPPSETESLGGWRHLFRALYSRNFRLFVLGQLISLIGTWIQQVAMSWLIYRLSHSAFLLGMVAFLSNGPGFVIAPFAGILADRFNRHKILIVAQVLAMSQAFILAYLTLSGRIEVVHILFLSVLMGIVTGVEIPVRQVFVTDMLDNPNYLSNAISLNSSVFNGTRLVGPAIAGVAIASIGEGWCFFLNGLSYIAVAAALLSMRLKPRPVFDHKTGYLESIREGFTYVYRFPPMRIILTLVALISLVGLPYSALMPIFAKDILHGNERTLGYLMGAVGAGALTGAIHLASRPNVLGLVRLIPVALGCFGFSLIGFACSHVFWLSLLLAYGLGLGMIVQLASSNILLQTLADESMRGRVMSIYTMAFLGMTPFGSLVMGSVASHMGVSATLMVGGCLCILGATFFQIQLPQIRQMIHPIYVQKGIIKETIKVR
jgi:MFS family permease